MVVGIGVIESFKYGEEKKSNKFRLGNEGGLEILWVIFILVMKYGFSYWEFFIFSSGYV